MTINYTTIGPIDAKMTAKPREGEGMALEREVTVVAFGWNNSEPEQITGVWALGGPAGARGLAFIRRSQIERLEPISGLNERAIRALEEVTEAFSERDEAVRQAHAAERVAVAATHAAIRALRERDVAVTDELAAERVAVAATRAAARAHRERDVAESDELAAQRAAGAATEAAFEALAERDVALKEKRPATRRAPQKRPSPGRAARSTKRPR